MTKLSNWIYGAAMATVLAGQPLSAWAQEETPAEGTDRVILEADYVYENEDENLLIAEGNVEAMYEGRILRADRLTYNKTTDKVRAAGNVVIIEADGSQQFADEIEVDSDLADGYAIGYSARLPEGATVVANSAIRQKDGINALDQVIYTSCDVCEEDTTPTWALRARKAVLDQESQMISYRDAVLEVAGIPVFYFPYLAHPDPSSDRRSGLLIPSAGVSSKLGAYYQQPYYWAINDSSDLTIAPLLSSNVNPMLELDYRKRFYSGAIDINTSVTYESDFNSDGDLIGDKDWRSHIFAKGLFAITPEWQWGFGLERQTDDLYDRRYSLAGQGSRRGLYKNQPRRLLSQLFVVGQGENYYTDASLLSFQGLREGDENSNLPLVAPVFYGEKYWDFGNLGFASVNASATGITRDEGVDSQRVSLGAEWSDLNVLPGGFTAEPFVEVRGDYYALDEALSGKDNVTRAVGNAGLKVSYPLVRPGKTVDIMIEPTVMAAWGFSNVNDRALPNEDSRLYEFDESALFEGNAFSNYDLYEGDSKISAGISSRAVWKGGTELSGSIGRRWRGRADPTFDVASNLDGTTSDWVATMSADLGRALRVDTRMRLDDGFSLNRIDARLSSTYKRVRAVGQYYKISERVAPLRLDENGLLTRSADEGIYLRGEVRVTDRYSLIYGQLHDLEEGLNARSELGIAYEDDCSRFELVYTRSELRDRTLGPSENFQFRFSLKSLGEFGSSEFD